MDDYAKHIYLPSFSELIKVRNVFITNLFLVFCPQGIVRSSSSQEIKSHVQAFKVLSLRFYLSKSSVLQKLIPLP